MAELEIVVRARDQLTEGLRSMGTSVERFARQSVGQFDATGVAVDRVALGLAGAGQAAGTFGTQAGAAAQGAAKLGTVNVDPLRVALTATRVEIDKIAATSPVSPEAVQRMADLEEQARRAEDALIGVGGVDIDIARKVAQAEQAFERLGSEASLVPLQVEIGRARAEVERLEGAAREAGGKVSELDRTRIDQLKRGIREGESALVGLRTGTTAAAGGARTMSTAFTSAGAAIKGALLPLLPIFGLAGAAFFAKKAADDSLAFTSALGQIRTEGALTAAEIEALGESARATARALGLADADAAPVLLAAVTDGAKDAADGLERYNAALRLSAVTGGDAKRTTDVLTSALNAYARQGLGAARAADVLFEVSRAGKVEIDALAGGLEGILPLASQLGIGFEELGAVLVTATRQGGGFEQGVQAIRAALGALTSISDEGREALRGIDYSAAAIRARGLVPVLADISARLQGNSDAIRAVFPDGRSFGALLTVLANDGRDLSDALGELAGSSGAVEDALGRKLQSPLVQLGIIVNRLRSELGQALEGAFLRGVEQVVQSLGGMEATTRTIAEIAKSLGSVFGSVFPAIASVIAEATKGLQHFIEGVGGADAIAERMKSVGDSIAKVLGASLKIARVEIEALVRTILLIPQTVLAVRSELSSLTLFGEAEEELESIDRKLGALKAALAGLETPEFFKGEDLRPVYKAALEFVPQINDDVLRKKIGELEKQRVDIKARIDGANGFENLSKNFEAVQTSLVPLDDAIEELGEGLRDVGRAFTQGVQQPAERTFESVRAELDGVTESLQVAEDEMRFLRGTAARAFSELDGDAQKSFLADLASRAAKADEALRANEAAARALKLELSGFVLSKIEATEKSIRSLEAGLRSAADQAGLLGLQGEQASTAISAVGSSDDEQRLAALRATLKNLRNELAALKEAETIVVAPKIVDVPGIGELFKRAMDGFRAISAKITETFDPATTARLGRASGVAFRDGILASIGNIDPFEETLQAFRGGVEPSLERQAELVDVQVQRQRDATDELRIALPMLRALGLLDERRVAALEQATDELDKQADSLRDQAANVRRGLRLEAISLGIEPNLDDDALRKEIERVRERAALETEAVRLGVSVALGDEDLTAGVRDAKAALDAGMAEIQRDVLEREAIRLGVSVDSDNIELDVARARDDAQAFADQLQGEGIRREAITLGIDISGRSVEQIRQDIASVRNEADQFAAQNPIASEALVSGIRGFGNAIGQIASGAQTAREALSSFFQSFVQQVAGAIAQALLLRAIISSVGGTGTGVGAFLASAFGVPAKDGAVIPAARGMAVPALAAAALAVAPLAMGAPVGLAAGGQPVAAFAENVGTSAKVPTFALAQGGTPHLNRIVSAPTYAPLASLAGSAVVPLSGGGVQTTSGAKLPVEKQGRELVIAAAQGIAAPLYTFAQGGPVALYGEAGPEAIMRTYAAPGGGPGLRMASGGVAPLTRVSGGRLGVALADGGAIRTDVLPFALGGVGNIERTVATRVLPFALGGVQGTHTPARIVPLALGGLPAAASEVLTARPVAPVNVSVPVNVNVAGGSQVAQEDPRQTEARLQAAISGSSRVREAIAAVVSRELEARPTFRANVRGDRA